MWTLLGLGGREKRKQTEMAPTQTQVVYDRLYRTFAALDRAHERWLGGVGSNGARYAILASLAESSTPLTPSDVSETTGRSPNAISPLLRALEREGLIKRSPNSADRRSHYLSLTAAGKRTAQKLKTEENAFVKAILKGRSGRDLVALDKNLQAIEEQAGSVQRNR